MSDLRFGAFDKTPNVHETDEYMERRETDPTPEPASPWVRKIFQPAVVAILIGCIAWPIADFTAQMSPWPAALFWLAPVAMAVVGFTTQRALQHRLVSGIDSTKARLVEIGLLFLLIKLLNMLNRTIPEVIASMRGWTQNPWSFFDGQTLLAFGIGMVAWIGAGLTARDLDALADPTMYIGETGPRKRLASRYFVGGAVLLIFAALSRVNLMSVLEMENPRLTRPIISALIYFLLGLVMLSQIQFARLTGLWRRENVTIAEHLNATWVRYSLLALALAAVIAFVLPTGYTIGLLDLVAMLFFLLSYLATFLYLMILWPIGLLFSLLMGKPMQMEAPSMQRPPMMPQAPPPTENGSPLWAYLRSIAFWVVLIATAIYLVRSYLRDRPELMETLRGFAPLRWITQIWQAVRQWMRKASHRIQERVPALLQRLRGAATGEHEDHRRAGGPGLREQIFYQYLSTLDRAKEQGFPRRDVETPYEYRRTLEPHLPEGQEAMGSLTEAFVEARYTDHEITPEMLAQQQTNAETLRRALRKAEEEQENKEEGA